MEIPSGSALIVIDSQNDFVNNLPEEMEGGKVLEEVIKTITYFRSKKLPIVHFREIHRQQHVDFGRELDGDEGVHCIEGTYDADYCKGVEPLESEYKIDKRRYSGFFATDLDLLLRGLKVQYLYIVGFLTDVCVHYTSVDAHQHDYHIKVFKEAVGGSSLAAHNASLNAIEYLQHGAVISTKELED
ncbi:MAG: isochorismatase family cysteine hydrolase [Bacillota bacterium]